MSDDTEMGRLQGVRILVVEDAPHVRDAFSLLLKSEGAAVLATGSGCEAIEMAKEGRLDVLLTDLELPDVPGDFLIRQVLDQAGLRPRVVVVTAADESVVKYATQAGADTVLLKPITWERLLENLAPHHSHTLAA
ncbi:MAG TPA: response regulator [Methylomirabilota bacterium]|jgi:two-component system CheB/CheR fusion protein|nr:response regulator [Methylomirabilota bacterium]